MRFFAQKKRLNHFDLSVLKGFEDLLAEWTGLEPFRYYANLQVIIISKNY